ncbi:hypothetical protein [Peloplasma aerotolerans]|uniref:Signal peptidase I n=1 Tax=Peloplasma aerotolerans TaxID=3044389 RepID=A0AAW6U7J5_9MOLU|nr:hypothetical protein [Mariniplasma sp. M4Ah]MDI6452905.1 hypothetical protein [Mariniplasma sp. M4Ah]
MANYLSTEELLAQLASQKVTSDLHIQKKVRKFNIKINKKTIFWIFVGLAILHTMFIAFPLILPNRGIGLLGTANVLAVPNNQELDEELSTRIVIVKRLKLDDLKVGDNILIYGRFGTDIYWVEEVVEIRESLNELQTTFDGFISNTTSIDDIDFVYIKDASFLGTIYYVSSNLRGFLVMASVQGLILSIIYVFYIKENKK